MTQNDSAPKPKSRKGCVIAVLIGLVFLLVLAALAIPDFMKMMAPPWNQEVRAYLVQSYEYQKAYFDKYGRYAGHQDGKKCFELMKFKSPQWRHKNLYTYYCDTDIFFAKKGNNSSCPVPDVPLVTKDSFTIFAVANIDSDPACDIWSINDAGKIIVHFDDVKEDGNPRTESPGPPSPQPKP